MEQILKEVETELICFKRIIKILNEVLTQKYRLRNHPYLNLRNIPSSGLMNKAGIEFSYRFHGGGCEFIYNEIILDYQIAPIFDENNIDIKISIWKFCQFLKSKGKDSDVYSPKKVYCYFQELIKKEVITCLENNKNLFCIN